MIELPYFKFFPNQWITGSVAFMDLETQGAFIKTCCYYWSKGCDVPRDQLKQIIPHHYDRLLKVGLLKINDDKISIKWLDDQYDERKQSHMKRVNAGRKGGKATQNKQCLTNDQALKKDNIKKDKYANDNLLKVDPTVQKILDDAVKR